MTKEEAWLVWMTESNYHVEYEWDIIKKSSWWDAFSRGWDAASVNVNGWDDAYKMGVEAGKEKHWVGLTDADKQEAFDETQEASGGFWEFADYLDAKLKEKNT